MTRTPTAWCLLIALWGCDGRPDVPAEWCLLIALGGCAGRPDVPAEFRDVEVPEAVLSSSEAQADGRRLYEQHCILCHGTDADGRGVRHTDLSAHPPNFNTPAWRSTVSPRYVYAVVRGGKRGTSMPSFRALSRDDTWKLVAYVLSLTPETPDTGG